MQHKSQQIASYNIRISQLTEEVETLSSSLQEKETEVSHLESEYQSYQKAATLKHLSDMIVLTTETAQLKQRLQEVEFQKQQTTLEKETALQEVKAKKKVELQLHRNLGKVVVKSRKLLIIYTHPHIYFNYLQMNLPKSLTTLKALRMLSWMTL